MAANRSVIFDIDGTIADISHRLHFIQQEPKAWNHFKASCMEDQVNEDVKSLMWAFQGMFTMNIGEILDIFISDVIDYAMENDIRHSPDEEMKFLSDVRGLLEEFLNLRGPF